MPSSPASKSSASSCKASNCPPKAWCTSPRWPTIIYRFDRASHTLTGNRSGNAFRLGDLVKVEVARVDIDRRELDFRIVQRKGHLAPPPKLSHGKKKNLRQLKEEAKRHKKLDKRKQRESKRHKRGR